MWRPVGVVSRMNGRGPPGVVGKSNAPVSAAEEAPRPYVGGEVDLLILVSFWHRGASKIKYKLSQK